MTEIKNLYIPEGENQAVFRVRISDIDPESRETKEGVSFQIYRSEIPFSSKEEVRAFFEKKINEEK